MDKRRIAIQGVNMVMFDKRLSETILHLMIMFMAAFIVIAGLTPTVYADMGPKPSATITVINAPSDEYYIAMLCEDNGIHREYIYNDSLSQEENAVISTIYDYNEEGYALFVNYEAAYFKSDSNHSYKFFGYSGVLPKTFKIMIITMEGSVQVSPEITSKAFNASITYDYSSNTLYENKTEVVIPGIVRGLIFLLITLLTEGLVLSAFGLFCNKNLIPFIVINIITQIMLNTFNVLWGLFCEKGSYATAWIIAEVVIIIIEATWYSRRLIGKKGNISVRRNITYAIVANIISAVADLPVYLILMFSPITHNGPW